jgi:hypothetical protein
MSDSYQYGKVTYPLDEVLLLLLRAVLVGAETFVDIARFSNKKLDLRRSWPFAMAHLRKCARRAFDGLTGATRDIWSFVTFAFALVAGHLRERRDIVSGRNREQCGADFSWPGRRRRRRSEPAPS